MNATLQHKFIFGTPWLPDLLCKHWLRHQYGISASESQTFFRAKRPQLRRARRNGCFRRLGVWSCLFVWDQVTVAYSTIGLTKDRYARALTDQSHDERFLWRIFKTLIAFLFSVVTLQLPTQHKCYMDAEVLLVASTVKLRITKGVTKLGRRILQSDLHNKTFCRS